MRHRRIYHIVCEYAHPPSKPCRSAMSSIMWSLGTRASRAISTATIACAMRNAIHSNKSCHTQERAMAHPWMHHGTYMKLSWHRQWKWRAISTATIASHTPRASTCSVALGVCWTRYCTSRASLLLCARANSGGKAWPEWAAAPQHTQHIAWFFSGECGHDSVIRTLTLIPMCGMPHGFVGYVWHPPPHLTSLI